MHARTSSIPLVVPVAIAAFDAVNGLPLELIYVPVGATFETGGDWALSVAV